MEAKTNYGFIWETDKCDHEWFNKIHNDRSDLHEHFVNFFLDIRNEIESVLEIGCGSCGFYPLFFSKENVKYSGIDISTKVVNECRKAFPGEFLCFDFLKEQPNMKFDLVFSHAVIDHVYDCDIFLSKIIESSKKYIFISSYRGVDFLIDQHKYVWSESEGCYFNIMSAKRLIKSFPGVKMYEFSGKNLKKEAIITF